MTEKLFASIQKWFQRSWPFLLAYVLILLLFFKQFLGSWKIVAAYVSGIFKYRFSLINPNSRSLFLTDITPVLTPDNVKSIYIFIFILISFMVLYRISMFITAQFVLPVRSLPDRIKAYRYSIKYSKGKHGPAMFVKEGEQIEKAGEQNNAKPGVLLVDLSSAVALRKKEKPKFQLLNFNKKKKVESDALDDIQSDEKLDAKGPGVVFTESGQRIISSLDLRKQSRTSDEIEAYTRDGIRVKTKISITFSISDDPENISVGSVRDENGGIGIKGLVFSPEDKDGRVTLKDVFELEEEDAVFIKNYSGEPHEAPSPAVSTSPYKLNPDRILKAALSSARKTGGELKTWYDAPMELATDIFRKMLSGVQYDDLFSGAQVDSSSSPTGKTELKPSFISTLKTNFGRSVKNKGLLKFQHCEKIDRTPFILGQAVPGAAIKKGPSIVFSEPKYNSVRKYGIVVLSAGFGEIRPVDGTIQEKMIQNWRVKLQNEIDLIRAEYELEAIRVKNRNRAQIQQETTYLLSSIFQSVPHFEEALALRVLDALETAVTDPSKQDMTSAELYTMLENLYKWLLPSDERPDNNPPGPAK